MSLVQIACSTSNPADGTTFASIPGLTIVATGSGATRTWRAANAWQANTGIQITSSAGTDAIRTSAFTANLSAAWTDVITTPLAAPTSSLNLLVVRNASAALFRIQWATDGRFFFFDNGAVARVIATAGTLSLGTQYVFQMWFTIGTSSTTGSIHILIKDLAGNTVATYDNTAANLGTAGATLFDIDPGGIVGTYGHSEIQYNDGATSFIAPYTASTPTATGRAAVTITPSSAASTSAAVSGSATIAVASASTAAASGTATGSASLALIPAVTSTTTATAGGTAGLTLTGSSTAATTEVASGTTSVTAAPSSASSSVSGATGTAAVTAIPTNTAAAVELTTGSASMSVASSSTSTVTATTTGSASITTDTSSQAWTGVAATGTSTVTLSPVSEAVTPQPGVATGHAVVTLTPSSTASAIDAPRPRRVFTATLDSRPWSASLNDRTLTATLDPRRWEARLG